MGDWVSVWRISFIITLLCRQMNFAFEEGEPIAVAGNGNSSGNGIDNAMEATSVHSTEQLCRYV